MRPKQAGIEGESYPSIVHGQTPRNFKTKKGPKYALFKAFFFVCVCVKSRITDLIL